MNKVKSFFDKDNFLINCFLENEEHQNSSYKEKQKSSCLLTTHQLGIRKIEEEVNLLDDFIIAKAKKRKFRQKSSLAIQTTPKKIKEKKEGHPLNEKVNQAMAEFLGKQSPAQWLPLFRNAKGKIKYLSPSRLENVKRIIYIFKNKVKDCYLIGKTGQTFMKRSYHYFSLFNRPGSEERVKRKGTKNFLCDVKADPEHFEMGILYVLKPEEDINFFEKEFIENYRQRHLQLYNENRGGGGGLAHAEENLSAYAVPKPRGIQWITPEKYYPYRRNKKGHILPCFTPGFREKMKEMKENMEEGQIFIYVIKQLTNNKRYIGYSGDPETRANYHGYQSGYCDPKNKKKYDPARKSGRLYPAIAENPEEFGIGLLPIKSEKSISSHQKKQHRSFQGIGNMEKYAIKIKKSLYTQHGFNSNRGGGGPIPESAKKR